MAPTLRWRRKRASNLPPFAPAASGASAEDNDSDGAGGLLNDEDAELDSLRDEQQNG